MSDAEIVTELNIRVVACRPDEPDIDVTEAVRAMFDLLRSSMDWGSGFLSIEEVIEVTRLAAVCGFLDLDGANDQMQGYMRTLIGTCPICKFQGSFVLGEVTEHGRIARLERKWGQEHLIDEHHAILIQPRHEPAYLYWPDLALPDPSKGAA